MKRFLAREADIEIIGEAGNGREAIESIKQLQPDLLFIDIQIPEGDGFAVLEQIGDEGLPPAIIFVTAYDRYAIRAFDFHALDYLLKPYTGERFRRAVERARALIQQARASDNAANPLDERLISLLAHLKSEPKYLERLMIKTSGRVFFLRADEIDWIESEGNYVRLHAGREAHLLRETMNRLASRLDPEKFIRIHRSTLVHIERIKELQPMFGGEYTVILRDGTQLTLSRSHRDKLLELFENS